jgi:glyceraldehyde 3-phosphate dehydrogenase
MINFSINGFGRIGRSATRVWLESHTDRLNLVAINTSGSLPISGWAHLLKYDTAYGRLPYPVTVEETKNQSPLIGFLVIQKPNQVHKIPVLAQRDPEKIPWSKYKADLVIESTGIFRTQDEAKKHLKAGAKLVIISAPAKGGSVPTAVIGVNEDEIVGKDRVNSYTIVSNASCTTNCVAPVAAVMHGKIGVLKAVLTTIHGYTDDQNLQDNSHKDMRRTRAAAQNIIPTTTGAATATTEAIPELKGLFQGLALRVPVITGSITDFTFVTKRSTSVEEVNEVFKQSESSPLYKDILATTEESLVSSDIIGRPESAIVDLGLTKVVDGTLVKVMAWYDNEYGYANRLVEQITQAGESL